MKKRLFTMVLALVFSFGLCTIPALAYGHTGTVGRTNVIACGNRSVAVIDSNNTLWVWGSAQRGLWGDMEAAEDYFSTIWYDVPKRFMENVRAVSVSADDSRPFAAVIKTDGSLWTWGWNDSGRLGNGGKGTKIGYDGDLFQLTPLKVMDNVVAVSCGLSHAAAIKTDGSLWVWGSNNHGEIGNNQPEKNQNTPVKIMDNVAAVSCGQNYTAAVKTDGTLWMWGDISGNRFNNGGISNYTFQHEYIAQFTYSCQTVPVKVMDNALSVYCGVHIENPFVLQKDGTLVTWAKCTETEPQHVDKDGYVVPERPIPPKEPLPLQVIAQNVSTVVDGPCYPLGRNVVAYIKNDGSLWTYGDNRYGQLGDPALIDTADTTYENATKVLDNVVAVDVMGSNNVIAVKSDGSLWMWGLADSMGNGVSGNYQRTLWDMSGKPFKESCQTVPLRVTNITAKLPENGKVPIVSTVGGFTDVKETDYFANAVLWAVEKNITSGTSATTFSPNATCSKAQILTFLWRANSSPEPTADNPFTDIKPADYFYKAALWTAEKGLVSGSTFGANTDCTRAMTVEYLWKAAGSPATSSKASFTDVPAGADYGQAVAWAVEKGITSGTSKTTFSPGATCIRGQIVTFLYRAMT